MFDPNVAALCDLPKLANAQTRDLFHGSSLVLPDKCFEITIALHPAATILLRQEGDSEANLEVHLLGTHSIGVSIETQG